MSILDQLKALCAAREKAMEALREAERSFKYAQQPGFNKENWTINAELCVKAAQEALAANLDYPRLIAMVERYEAALQKIANRPDLPNPERDADWKNCMKWSAHEALEALAKETPIEIMTKTPADEALKKWKQALGVHKLVRGYDIIDQETWDQTEKALSLLSAVQGGKVKVLEREPTDKMIGSGAMKFDKFAKLENKICNMYRGMYDTAESYAAPSAAEVGESS